MQKRVYASHGFSKQKELHLHIKFRTPNKSFYLCRFLSSVLVSLIRLNPHPNKPKVHGSRPAANLTLVWKDSQNHQQVRVYTDK